MSHCTKRTGLTSALVAGALASLALLAVPGHAAIIPATTIGEGRLKPIGSAVHFTDKIVTRVYTDRYYIEEPDRSAGIAVILLREYVPGQVVEVQGTLALEGGELVVDPATDTPAPDTPLTPLAPLGMNQRDSVRPLSEGLLVQVWGKVVASKPFGGAFRIEDGSGLLDSASNPGLRIYTGGVVGSPLVDTYVRVTGVRGSVTGNAGDVPVVRINSEQDVEILKEPIM